MQTSITDDRLISVLDDAAGAANFLTSTQHGNGERGRVLAGRSWIDNLHGWRSTPMSAAVMTHDSSVLSVHARVNGLNGQ